MKHDIYKKVLALCGVMFLIGLYITTLLLAILGNESTITLLKASLYATVVLPVLFWIYSYIYRLLKKHVEDSDTLPNAESDTKESSEDTSSED